MVHGVGVPEGSGFSLRGADLGLDLAMESAAAERDFAGIIQSLDESHDAVWKVARMLNDKGHAVKIPVTTKASCYAEWEDHADDGDLFIERRVEVKQLSADFTSAADWPYGEKFIVCARHSWDRAKPKPWCYIILSCSGTHAATVFDTTRQHWFVEERSDSRREDVRQQFYFCPLERVKFFRIPTGRASE